MKMISITAHVRYALGIRLFLSIYSIVQDQYFNVKYTDIDFTVFSEGAKRILNKESPYINEEYRYSPLLSVPFIPRNYFQYGDIIAKIFISIVDVLVGYTIAKITRSEYGDERRAIQCSLMWLYNPVVIVISTRGNVDALIALIVLQALKYHLSGKYIASGLLLGLSVHLRLYPIIFLIPFYLATGTEADEPSIRRNLFSFFKQKLIFLSNFAISLGSLTALFFKIYGNTFLEQTIFYHLKRLDFRHNLSSYFYAIYLNPGSFDLVWQKVLMSAPLFVVLLAFTLKYNSRRHLAFCTFANAFAFVIFNKVITCQYYLWYFSLFPLILPAISLTRRRIVSVITTWTIAHASWLLFAYLLEFQGKNTFLYLWISSVIYFVSNSYVLTEFVSNYNKLNFPKPKAA